MKQINIRRIDIIGYRTEQLYGEGYRGLFEVLNHEVFELGNTDILSYLNLSEGHIQDFCHFLMQDGYNNCIWLCKTERDLINSYLLEETDYIIDEYEIIDGIILSDLGEQGVLVAYRNITKR